MNEYRNGRPDNDNEWMDEWMNGCTGRIFSWSMYNAREVGGERHMQHDLLFDGKRFPTIWWMHEFFTVFIYNLKSRMIFFVYGGFTRSWDDSKPEPRGHMALAMWQVFHATNGKSRTERNWYLSKIALVLPARIEWNLQATFLATGR